MYSLQVIRITPTKILCEENEREEGTMDAAIQRLLAKQDELSGTFYKKMQRGGPTATVRTLWTPCTGEHAS